MFAPRIEQPVDHMNSAVQANEVGEEHWMPIHCEFGPNSMRLVRARERDGGVVFFDMSVDRVVG